MPRGRRPRAGARSWAPAAWPTSSGSCSCCSCSTPRASPRCARRRRCRRCAAAARAGLLDADGRRGAAGRLDARLAGAQRARPRARQARRQPALQRPRARRRGAGPRLPCGARRETSWTTTGEPPAVPGPSWRGCSTRERARSLRPGPHRPGRGHQLPAARARGRAGRPRRRHARAAAARRARDGLLLARRRARGWPPAGACSPPTCRASAARATPARTTSPSLVAQLAALVEAEVPGGRVDVVGHDWGGSLALALAGARPDLVRRLVVANAPFRTVPLLRAAHIPFFALPVVPELLFRLGGRRVVDAMLRLRLEGADAARPRAARRVRRRLHLAVDASPRCSATTGPPPDRASPPP